MGLAAGRKGHLPKLFSYLSITHKMPVVAIIFNTGMMWRHQLWVIIVFENIYFYQPRLSKHHFKVFAIIMVIPDGSSFSTLMGYTGFTIWLIYGMAFIAVIVMRFTWQFNIYNQLVIRTRYLNRKSEPYKNADRRYRVPIVIPFFVLLVAIFMTFAPIISDPKIEYLVVCGVIATGLIVYIPMKMNWSINIINQIYNHFEAKTQEILKVWWNDRIRWIDWIRLIDGYNNLKSYSLKSVHFQWRRQV